MLSTIKNIISILMAIIVTIFPGFSFEDITKEDILAKYGQNIKVVDRVAEVLSGAMGNQMYLATFPTEEEMNTFYADVTREK